MNFSALNETPLNVGVNDATIRGLVVGLAFAMISAQSRLMLRVGADNVATFGPLLANANPHGKVLTRLLLTNPNGQAVSSPLLRILSRSAVAAQAFASASPAIRTILLRLSAQASAQAVPVLRALQRDVTGRQGTAATSYLARKLAREAIGQLGLASATPVGRGLARSPFRGEAAASAALVRLIAMLRSPSTELAVATGYIGGRTTILYKYDLPAIPENTFVVPFEDNLFYVR